MEDSFFTSIEVIIESYNKLKREFDVTKQENVRLKSENTRIAEKNSVLEKTVFELQKNNNCFNNSNVTESSNIQLLKSTPREAERIKKRKIIDEDSQTASDLRLLLDDDNMSLHNRWSPDRFSSPPMIKSSPLKINYPSESPVETNTNSKKKLSEISSTRQLIDPKSKSLPQAKLYNSQIPTQYSNESSPIKSSQHNLRNIFPHPGNGSADESYPSNRHIKLEKNSQLVIEDSEDEFEHSIIKKEDPLKDITNINVPIIPKSLTKLQRREHLRDHFVKLFTDVPDFKIDLTNNPINESTWVLTDFKPNPDYTKPKILKKIGYSKQQQQNIDEFYRITSLDIHPQPPQVDEINHSQYFDKFPSPPGFMVSDFPSTQENIARKKIIYDRQRERLLRRISSCLAVSQGKQSGEFIFFHDVLNYYVVRNRYTVVHQDII